MSILEFYDSVEKLKDVKREGWIDRGVKNPESVADHSFMMAILCMVIPCTGVDKGKAIRMALVHDLAESVTGDLISKENWPSGGSVTNEEKRELEKKALEGIVSGLDSESAKEIVELWTEFNEGTSREARFVNEIDVAQMIIRAIGYQKEGNFKKPMEPFWDKRNLSKIHDKNIKKLLEELIPMGR
jgi:putative hydrolase of HD superfamily